MQVSTNVLTSPSWIQSASIVRECGIPSRLVAPSSKVRCKSVSLSTRPERCRTLLWKSPEVMCSIKKWSRPSDHGSMSRRPRTAFASRSVCKNGSRFGKGIDCWRSSSSTRLPVPRKRFRWRVRLFRSDGILPMISSSPTLWCRVGTLFSSEGGNSTFSATTAAPMARWSTATECRASRFCATGISLPSARHDFFSMWRVRPRLRRLHQVFWLRSRCRYGRYLLFLHLLIRRAPPPVPVCLACRVVPKPVRSITFAVSAANSCRTPRPSKSPARVVIPW